MASLPTGTVTFLFTDIEGSTRLLQQLGDAYADALGECRRMVRAAVAERGGQEVDTEGDAVFAAFPSARAALIAAITAQQGLLRHPWPDGAPVRVRVGLHTGEARVAEGGYVGMDVHRAARIAAAAHGGQILVSDVTYGLVARDLPQGVSLRDLGEHRLKDLAHPHRLFQVLAPDLPADFPALRSLDALPHNLPVQLTSFVGREQEMAEIRRHLGQTRLLTLTGTGGCGKTRLALQMASDLLEEYEDGVWLVEMEALSDPFLVPTAVTSVLGLREEPGRPLLSTLTDSLRSKKLLLVLDNCEHLIEACARLAESLLRACPGLRCLATSREPLNIAGEVTWRVPSLSLPPRRSSSMDGLISSEAGRLFMQRARTVVPAFTVTPADASRVAEICHRLDGIPLAIELVATRVRSLTLEQIAARLDNQFALVSRGTRTALPRHQTLRATLDWSYDLLSPKEQLTLRRLAVFAGEFALQAAEAVCAGEGLEESELLDLLAQLVEKSLVLTDERGAGRYRLLETVRRYAEEKLRDSGETDVLRSRHQAFFLKLAEEAEPQLSGFQQAIWMDRLEQDHANFVGAMEWSLQHAPEAGLRIAGAMWEFWEARGYLSEGQTWLDRLLEAAGPAAAPAARAKALKGAAVIARDQGDSQRAETLLAEAMILYRGLADVREVASVLNTLGLVHWHKGVHASARTHFEQALALWREVGYQRGVAASLANLGNLSSEEGDYATARSLYEQSLNVLRDLGDQRVTATLINNLGLACLYAGEYDLARSRLEQSLSIRRTLGDRVGIAQSLINLGFALSSVADYPAARSALQESLALSQDLKYQKGVAESLVNLGAISCCEEDYASAHRLLEQSLRIMRALGEKRGIVVCLEESANLAAAQGEPAWAAQIFGAAQRLRDELGARAPLSDPARHDRCLAMVRSALGEDAFLTAYARGQVASSEQSVNDVMKWEMSAGQTGPAAGPPGCHG